MIWLITAYNGTTWTAPYQMLPEESIERFMKDTGLNHWDIKSIVNCH
jgi:hypothetical protein